MTDERLKEIEEYVASEEKLAIDHHEPTDEASWGQEFGIIFSIDEAKSLIAHIRSQAIELEKLKAELVDTEKILEFESKNHFRCHTRLDQLEAVKDHNRPDIHPEDICGECGGENPVWYAPNELWNKVTGHPAGLIICPSCFQRKADNAGLSLIFSVHPVGQDLVGELAKRTGAD